MALIPPNKKSVRWKTLRDLCDEYPNVFTYPQCDSVEAFLESNPFVEALDIQLSRISNPITIDKAVKFLEGWAEEAEKKSFDELEKYSQWVDFGDTGAKIQRKF